MQKNLHKLLVFVLLVVMIAGFALPVSAATTATVDVRVEVYKQADNSGFANVSVTLGQNTKITNRRGFAEFKLKNIPTETMVPLSVVDPDKPNGSHAKLNLKLDTVTSEVVHAMDTGGFDIYIAYTENTETIVIRYMVTTNDDWELMTTEFEQSGSSDPLPADPEPDNPGEPGPEFYEDPPPDEQFEPGFDPDMQDMPEPGEPGFDPDMQPEQYEDYRGGVIDNLWLFIVIGVLGVGIIVLIILLAVKQSKKKKQGNTQSDTNNTPLQ